MKWLMAILVWSTPRDSLNRFNLVFSRCPYEESPFRTSFLERRFCCAKSVACGRVIEREWGNPQRFPPHTPPSLRYARVRTTKPVGNHINHHPLGGDFFACSSALTVVSAGSQPLPRPAVRTLPRNRLASSAAGGASALSSSERAS